MRLLVTGSRDWTSRAGVLRVFSGFSRDTQLVHGGARGLDKLAGHVADELGWPEPEVFEADWDAYGRRAGMLRNQEMVDQGADLCIGFPLPESKGTWDCMERAERAGILVVNGTELLESLGFEIYELGRGSSKP